MADTSTKCAKDKGKTTLTTHTTTIAPPGIHVIDSSHHYSDPYIIGI
jgi:hypothetical protein